MHVQHSGKVVMQGHSSWLLLVEHYLADSYVIHGTDQPQFTLVDHLAQYRSFFMVSGTFISATACKNPALAEFLGV